MNEFTATFRRLSPTEVVVEAVTMPGEWLAAGCEVGPHLCLKLEIIAYQLEQILPPVRAGKGNATLGAEKIKELGRRYEQSLPPAPF